MPSISLEKSVVSPTVNSIDSEESRTRTSASPLPTILTISSTARNGSYLAGILAGFEDDEVELKLADPGSPTLFQADDDLMVVLMPMRV